MTFSIFGEQGKAAVFTPAIAEGRGDYNAPRYAPVRQPLQHLGRLQFHSDFRYLEVAFRGTVPVAHPSVAHVGYIATTLSGPRGTAATPQPSSWRETPAVTSHVLHTHNLGYRPQVIVKFGNEVITEGFPIQQVSASGVRVLSVQITNTQVILRESVWTWAGSLPALSRTYEVIGFAKPEPVPEAGLVRIEPGEMIMGRGMIDPQRRYVRRGIAGEDRFSAPMGRTADGRNGVVRHASAAGTVRDDARFSTSAYNYDGSFGAGNVVSVPLAIADTRITPAVTKTGVDENGRFFMIDDGHVVFDTDRPLAKIVQSISLTNVDFSFPNPPQDFLVTSVIDSRVINADPPLYPRGYIARGGAQVVYRTWRPQEWSSRVVLATLVSSDANFFLCHANGSRTKAPAQIGGMSGVGASAPSSPGVNGPVNGSIGSLRNLSAFAAQNVWLQVNGTMTLEAAYMFRRTLSFAIEGNQLVAYLQQSIGGYNTNAMRGNVNNPATYDRSAVSTEVVARMISMQGWASRDRTIPFRTYTTTSSFDWSSVWRFNLNFDIGHV